MALIRKSVLVEQPAEEMFRLVDRVEDYPAFLPWCGGAELLARDETLTRARLHIAYHGARAHFATENWKEPPHYMSIRLIEGPFRHMDGSWRFTPLGASACKIEFQLHYEFSSKLLEKLLGPVFHRITNTLVDAFVKRAQCLTRS